MADLATLQTWLLEAELARHKLRTGALGCQVDHGDMRMMYTKVNASELDSYIDSLRARIVSAGGAVTGLRRRGLVVDL